MVMKGFAHTIESIFGAILILITLLNIYTIQTRPNDNLSELGYKCLKNIDNEGLLRYYALNALNLELNNNLRECLPFTIDFKFKVCSTSDCTIPLPKDKSIFLSSYLIAGDDSFNPSLINLWIWSK